MQFELLATDGAARRGTLKFPRGEVQTPAFMPVGTYGTVKGMLPRDIEDIGAEIILGNTFHLYLRPGTDIIEQHDRIRRWRLQQALGRTLERRPDLLAQRQLSDEEQDLLADYRQQCDEQKTSG